MAIGAGKKLLDTVLCRQSGVLSPYLFALYIDDVIKALRNSVYGILVGSIFAGCILYADDIVSLSCSFCCLQKNGQYNFVLSTMLAGISSFTLVKASASVLVVVSHLISLSHCVINLFSGYIS